MEREGLIQDWEQRILGLLPASQVQPSMMHARDKRLQAIASSWRTRDVRDELNQAEETRRKLERQKREQSEQGLGKKRSLPPPMPLMDAQKFRGTQDLKHWREEETFVATPQHEYTSKAPVPLVFSPGCVPFADCSKSTEEHDHDVLRKEKQLVYERRAGTQQDVDNLLLQFESRFESGNLDRVFYCADNQYELHVHADPGADRHYTQWFYFGVANIKLGTTYTFTIRDFYKQSSLLGGDGGCLPLAYVGPKQGWVRVGESSVRYHINDSKMYSLSFSFSLEQLEEEEQWVYFCPCFPYRYSDLQLYLQALETNPITKRRFHRRLLCRTLAGNRCDLLTITSSNNNSPKPIIILTSRVHPCESNSSWVMKGLLDFLTGPSLEARLLQERFVFKIIPMLNPDGVIHGNSRCSLAGTDLNRVYSKPNKQFHPTIWHLKRLFDDYYAQGQDVLLFCDFHGHSRKYGFFTYGCSEDKSRRSNQDYEASGTKAEAEKKKPPVPKFRREKKKRAKKSKERRKGGAKKKKKKKKKTKQEKSDVTLLPKLLARACCAFAYSDCSFAIKKSKESTGRVQIFRQSLGETLSYTVEASLGGVTFGPLEGYHLDCDHYEGMGHALADALLDFWDEYILGNANQVIETNEELEQEIIEGMDDTMRVQKNTDETNKIADDDQNDPRSEEEEGDDDDDDDDEALRSDQSSDVTESSSEEIDQSSDECETRHPT